MSTFNLGKLKTILKPFSNPNLEDDGLPALRILETNYLNKTIIRESRGALIRKIIYNKDRTGLPSHFFEVKETIGKYCGVFIIPIVYLHPGHTNPIVAAAVIGQEDSVELAEVYIRYIYNSVHTYYHKQLEHLRKKVKKERKMLREGKKIPKTGNIRIIASNYRGNILESINKVINNLLEIEKNTPNGTYYLNIGERDKIEKKLKAKYGPSWRDVLSKIYTKAG